VVSPLGAGQAVINNFANFWILAKGKNQNKSSRHPYGYFEDVDEKELKNAFIDRDFLDYRRFTTFIGQRKALMIEKVQEKLQFCDDDFVTDESMD